MYMKVKCTAVGNITFLKHTVTVIIITQHIITLNLIIVTILKF